MSRNTRYIPALSADWLTPLFDPLIQITTPERRFKSDLIARAAMTPGHRVLDLGAGTGTLAIMFKQAQPGVDVVGLDGDPAVLKIARKKAAAAGVEIAFDHGDAGHLPYPDKSFDRVLSSLTFHHLDRDTKQRAAREVFRVLKPGGEFWIADFGPPRGAWARLVASLGHGLEHAAENLDGLLPVFLADTGFGQVEEAAYYATIFGTVVLLRASKPAK